MDRDKIERINALARLQKARGLTDAEKNEQAALRRQFLDEFRAGMKDVMESITVVDETGRRAKLQKSGGKGGRP